MKLLTIGNPKTLKGERYGYLTFILHLAPANLSGYNVCPGSSAGCRAACLNTAGRGHMSAIQTARIRRTHYFFTNRNGFMNDLIADIRRGVKYAQGKNLIPVFRLNGTSDIRWENISVVDHDDGGRMHRNVMEMFPDIQFYDYTKLFNRRDIPANYHLTISRSEENDADIQTILNDNTNETNIAVVFSTKKGEDLPALWGGRWVVDGDDSDLRFLDAPRSIVGLRSKGRGKKDASNFVVPV